MNLFVHQPCHPSVHVPGRRLHQPQRNWRKEYLRRKVCWWGLLLEARRKRVRLYCFSYKLVCHLLSAYLTYQCPIKQHPFNGQCWAKHKRKSILHLHCWHTLVEWCSRCVRKSDRGRGCDWQDWGCWISSWQNFSTSYDCRVRRDYRINHLFVTKIQHCRGRMIDGIS